MIKWALYFIGKCCEDLVPNKIDNDHDKFGFILGGGGVEEKVNSFPDLAV